MEPAPTFEINEFRVEGNTLFSTDRITDLLDDLTGSDRSAADVEQARDTLERFYHDAGYPTVMVNIPEQSAEGGELRRGPHRRRQVDRQPAFQLPADPG